MSDRVRPGSPAALPRRRFLTTTASSALGLPLLACGSDAGRPEPDGQPPLQRPAGVDDAEWAGVRAQFTLEPGVAYMNNAGLGMPPAVVAEAVAAGYRAISAEPRRGSSRLSDRITEDVIPGLHRLLGARPGEVVLTRNATEALHLQAIGLDLEPGDEVIITTQEHPSGRRPWLLRTARHGIRVSEVFVPSPLGSEDDVVDLFERAVTEHTKAIAFCHVTRGGHLYPVKRLTEMARRRGILSLVDGAQAVGMFPIDLDDLGCDAYSASLHKWLLAPIGTGILYVRESARPRIRSAFAHDATPDAPAYAPPGTSDLPVRAGIGAALQFAETLGLDNVERRTRYLSDYLKDRLSRVAGTTLLSGSSPGTSCPGSTIFEIEGVDPLAAVPTVAEGASIHIDEHQRDGHNAIRVSTHVYNTTDEIDRLVVALEGLR